MTSSRRIPVFFLLLVLLVIVGSLSLGRTAYAAGVVNTCNEAGLTGAIAGGGTVTFNCNGTIVLTSQITISANTTIDGTGHNVTIDGNNLVRLFLVNAATTLTLNNLTLTNGLAPNNGGAISTNGGTLNIAGCTFSNNKAAPGWDGGAIFCRGSGGVTVSNSIFSGNSAAYSGAIELFDTCTLDISGSTFSGNTAIQSNGGAFYLSGGDVTVDTSSFLDNTAVFGGGAIDHYRGRLTITRSTFSNNAATGATGSGGAIINQAELIIGNSTFSGNSAVLEGGAIYAFDGSAQVTNCTFVGNSAPTGGTFYVYSDTQSGFVASITLTNTIVADSTSGGNCYVVTGGTLTDGGNNLQFGGSVANSCGATIPTPVSNPLGSNVLANNGGPTDTIALPLGSAAIDAGNDAVCAASPVNGIDQRGITRPQRSHCDIGAYEYQDPAVRPIPTMNEWGMIIFMVIAGIGSVYYLRRQSKVDI